MNEFTQTPTTNWSLVFSVHSFLSARLQHIEVESNKSRRRPWRPAAFPGLIKQAINVAGDRRARLSRCTIDEQLQMKADRRRCPPLIINTLRAYISTLLCRAREPRTQNQRTHRLADRGNRQTVANAKNLIIGLPFAQDWISLSLSYSRYGVPYNFFYHLYFVLRVSRDVQLERATDQFE